MENSQVTLGEKPELGNLKLLKGIYGFLIVTLVVMPQYFGVHLGYDITCSRLSDILLTSYLVLCPMMLTHFWKTSIRCSVFYPLMMYLGVAGYTMVFRTDINAFFLVFMEIYTFFLLIYGIRYVVGWKTALRYIRGCAYFFAFYGFLEFAYGRSIFLQFLATVPTRVTNGYRSGHYRLMGPCGHSLAYGLLLLIFIAIACYDEKKDELNLFCRPTLLVLLLGNVFLTGSRSTLGIAGMECILVLLLSQGTTMKKSWVTAVLAGTTSVTLIFLLQGTGIGRYMMGQLMSIVDQLLDTNFAARYGIDTTTLENSSAYREALPYIFTLKWLNPLVGRGSYFGGAEVRGVYLHSIDNYYIVQYIRYAYPGLISYVLFIGAAFVSIIREIVKYKSGLARMILVGAFCYFLNLWWVDALQTLKFVYLLLAVFFAYQLERKDVQKRGETAA